MNSGNYVLRFDSMTRILYVNNVRFEDLEPLEKNKVLGVLFKGGQERAAIEQERNEAEQKYWEEVEAHKNTRLNFQVLLTVFILTSVVLQVLGLYVW